mgnify:CR=1 FL=1
MNLVSSLAPWSAYPSCLSSITSPPRVCGVTLAVAALMGALYGFINTVQQVVFDVFKAPNLLVPVFSGIAVMLASR